MFALHVFAVAPDDDGEFAFVIDLGARQMRGNPDRVAGVLEGVDAFDEENGQLGFFHAGFLGVVAVVETNAEDLARDDGREELGDDVAVAG